MIPARQVARDLVQLFRRRHRFAPALRGEQRGIEVLPPVEQLSGIVVIDISVRQQPDVPLIRTSAKARLKPQASSGEAICLRLALK